MKALSSLLAISALALVPSLATADSGVSVDVYTSYSAASGGLDADGNTVEIPEGYEANFMLIELGVGYAVNDDLSLSLSLPIVSKAQKFEAMGIDNSSMGLGDVSLAARYMSKLNDTASVGAELRFKMATGADGSEDGTTAIGSGYHNIQAGIVAALAPVDNLSVDIDAGYIMSMGKTEDEVTVNPGDLMYANTYIGYDISGITPHVGVHYMSMGLASAEAAGNSMEVADSDASAIGVSAGLGTSLLHGGVNLPWGMALSGKNVTTGMAFNLGLNASF